MDALQAVWLTTSSTAFYLGLHAFSATVLVARLDQGKLARLPKGERLDVAEKFPSIVNGLITGLLSFWLIFVERSFEADAFAAWPPALDFFFCNLIGYTLYDLSVMFRQPHAPVDIWVHHALGLAGCAGMLYYRQAAFVPLAFGMTELTVVPHNALWLIRRFGDKDSLAYKASLLTRAVMFLVLRLPMLPFTVWYSYAHQGPTPLPPSWTTYVGKWRAVDPVVFYGTAINATVFGLLNTVWTAVIVYTALATFLLKSKKPIHARE